MLRKASFGITSLLACSFAAVAILAAAANLTAEHGLAVIRSGRGSPISPTRPSNMQNRVGPVLSEPVAAPELTSLDRESMAIAVERYKRAVSSRTTLDTRVSAAELIAATRALDLAYRAARAALESLDLPTGTLAARLQSYEAAGSAQVHMADARRTAIADYEYCTDRMDGLVSASLDSAWKIFGRVLARQSLMQMHARVGDLRHQFSRYSSGHADSGAALQALAEKETAVSDIFNGHAAEFNRSEGAVWSSQMRSYISAIVGLRHSLGEYDDQARGRALQLESASTRMVDVLPIESLRNATVPLVEPPPVSGSPGAAHLLPLATPVYGTASVTPESGDRDRDRRIVAWITASVLAILLGISIVTVRSIVGPVRRMAAATIRVSAGDVDVRVERGGIKELDTLAGSFNRMAAQLAAARDMTKDYQQRLEARVEQRTRELQHLAEHDPLTHLPNRRQLFVLLNHALDRAAQNERHVGVFFLDIDNFKNLNDSLGHAFGDTVLSAIAQRLKLAAHSFGFAGRLGGDEFTIVHEDAGTENAVVEAGLGLVALFERPFVLDGREIIVRASVGASIYPHHGMCAADLLSAADAALFRAKALGRGQLAVFTPALLETASRKFTIEQGLRRAIECNEFELVFQPEVSLGSLEMVLVESLIRWRLPDGRQAPPAEFLAVTEESGLIIEVGNWVLRRAIETAARWHHGEWPGARVAINVSPRQLLDQRFVQNIEALLREYALPAECIELELTESVLQTGPNTIDTLHSLRSRNIAIALDDFGTGYSSLASLETLPLSRIKLDRSLIASIDTNRRSAAIANALIGLCAGLGLEMTAEGVERPEQFAALARHTSINLQGYLISRPIADHEVVPMLGLMPTLMQDLLLSVPSRPVADELRFGHARAMAS